MAELHEEDFKISRKVRMNNYGSGWNLKIEFGTL